jgi:hypothetical protein
MVIHVNRQFLNFNLENEKNLKDILLSLEEWVAENGEIIQQVLVDDINIQLETETKELQRTVSSIGKIEVFTAKKEQHAIETVSTLTEFIRIIMGDYLRAEGTESYEDIMEGLQLVYEGIVEVVKVFGINDLFIIDREKRSLRSVLGEMRALYEKYEKKYIDKEGKDAFEAVLNTLFFLCSKLIKWGVVKNMKKFPMVQSDKKAEYLFADIHSRLEDVSEALKQGDMISVGDVLEYETKPLFEELIEFFGQIKDFTFFY